MVRSAQELAITKQRFVPARGGRCSAAGAAAGGTICKGEVEWNGRADETQSK